MGRGSGDQQTGTTSRGGQDSLLKTRVRTHLDFEISDWSADTIATRRDDATGQVVDKSDAHGLCYQVKHDDGTTSWYEPHELEPLS